MQGEGQSLSSLWGRDGSSVGKAVAALAPACAEALRSSMDGGIGSWSGLGAGERNAGHAARMIAGTSYRFAGAERMLFGV